MLKKINPKIDSYLFWVMLSVGVIVAYVIGRGDRYEASLDSRFRGNDSTAESVLNNVITSWIPDREVVSAAGITIEPFTARFGTFPDTVIHLAIMVQDSTGARAPALLGQWALESGFGKFNLNDHNYFGLHYDAVKQYMARPAYVIAYDRKLQPDGSWKKLPVRFAKFSSTEECFMIYGRYLAGSALYRKAFAQKGLRSYVRELSKRYAEDPGYAVKLLAIIERYNLAERAK